jgi:hypothetical protein
MSNEVPAIRDEIAGRVAKLVGGTRALVGARASMTVTGITDVHANLPALEAARGRVERLAIETIYCGGDLIG